MIFCFTGTDFERKVKQDLFGIKLRLTQIENTQELILSHLTGGNSQVMDTMQLKFPISNIQQFETLELKLEEDAAENEFVSLFSLCITLLHWANILSSSGVYLSLETMVQGSWRKRCW